MDKNILLEEIKNAIQIDGNFKNEVLNTLSIKIIDRDEAYRIINKVLKTFKLNVDETYLNVDKVLFSSLVFSEYICLSIGACYTLDLSYLDKNILSFLNEVCNKINYDEYSSFVKYFRSNYPDKPFIDVFELQDFIANKVNKDFK